ncbi:Prolyl endopeptidase [Orchesella cincta]|uniref:Prolyl endopeptidase n=1 Tax=Orchesella cincta TaxID=48709 RepID=A0A1D2M4L2_ORCCI|nr:Prolyl endopeptidase [Orchesella cincta]
MTRINYPDIRRDESVVDEYHGTKIADPYRWLEDPDSDEVQKFVEAQNNITIPFLEECKPREAIKTRLTELWNYAKYGCPFRRGDRYFYFKNTGLQNQSVLYMQRSLEEDGEVFLDPNTLSEDGTVAISTYAFSKNGEVFAYGLSGSGSDWITIHFKNVLTGENYPETLQKVKFTSLSWTHDNVGVFYGRYSDQEGKTDGSETTSNENQKLYYHRLGTEQSEDVLVVDFPENPKWRIGAEVSDCGNYLIVSPQQDCRDNLVFFADLSEPLKSGLKTKLTLTPVVTKFEADYIYVTNTGHLMYFRTSRDAPNYRIATIDFSKPISETSWQTVVPEHSKDVLDWTACVNGDVLVTCYIQDVKNTLQIRKLEDGSLIKDFTLEVGTIMGYSGRKEDSELFFQFASFLTPAKILYVDLKSESLEPKVVREVTLKGFNPSDFETTQVFYDSKDGTKIPMFIVHRKDLVKNGNNPCLLYGYGGFNISVQPTFSVTRIVLMQHMVVYLLLQIFVEEEYGESWHNGGRLLNKQNGFDDFQAAAQYLIDNQYTSSKKLAIQGASNGGLLVGACVNQRPDLFGAAIAQVGCSDYGCSDEKEHFDNLLKISPIHNVKLPEDSNGQYPSVLLLTADHDDRVVPLHSYKFIAEIQTKVGKSSQQENPLLIRIETKAGHGAGKPTAKIAIDHYHWLENSNAPNVLQFESAQNDLTQNFLKSCPQLNEVKSMLLSVSNRCHVSCPTEDVTTGRFYFFMNSPDENCDSIYVKEGLKGKPRLHLSPKDIPETNGKAVFRMYSLSWHGETLAYAYGTLTSTMQKIRFRETKTGKDYSEVLTNVFYSDISWTHDNKGIIYSTYLNSKKNEVGHLAVVFHRLGTKQIDDLIFVEFLDSPYLTLQAQISDCGELLFVYANEKGINQHCNFLYGDLKGVAKNNYETTPYLFHLLEGNGLEIQFITRIHGATYFRTNCRAPKFRIVRTYLLKGTKLTKGFWETIISEHSTRLLDWAVCVNKHYLLVCYVEEAAHKLQLHKLQDGSLLHKYSLPLGTITEYSGGSQNSRFFFTFSSFLIPDCIRYIQVPKHSPKRFRNALHLMFKANAKKMKYFNRDLIKIVDSSDCCLKQRFCVSPTDGADIPIFLIHKKGLKLNKQSPCIMYGQGCFGVQIMPSFCVAKLAFVKCFNGLIAIVGTRGGGEYGEEWYRGGTCQNKQQTYNDFIAASEYLIKLGYTSPSKLIIEGQQFGGNLAAACLVQRPDLYGAVIIHNGLLDLLRYHLLQESQSYLSEFGDPNIFANFENLRKISPLHNVLNENTFLKIPAVMTIVDKENGLAHPSNSYKFIAELQFNLASKSTKKNPFLLWTHRHASSGQGEHSNNYPATQYQLIFPNTNPLFAAD